LWGLRVRAQLLHDGRVSSGSFESKMTEVIGWHNAPGSEAAAAAAAFDALSRADKEALIAFLDSLGRAEFDHDGDNDVDLADFDQFDGCFTGEAPGTYTADDACAISDFDQDGDVDLKDYHGMQRAYTGPGL
jgi:hypothetical protein